MMYIKKGEDAERKKEKCYFTPTTTPAAGGTRGEGVQTVYWAL